MSEKITSANLDIVIAKNLEIENEVNTYISQLLERDEVLLHASPAQLGLYLLQNRGLILFPVEDPYWSGGIFVKDGKMIPVINTALPRVNQYFTAFHEVYHLFFDRVSFDHQIASDITLEERKADLFAAKLILSDLIPYFKTLPACDITAKVFFCMSMYQAPYKAVMIALYEYAVQNDDRDLSNMIKSHFDDQFENLPERFRQMGLDDSLVMPSYLVNINSLKEKMTERKNESPDLNYHALNESFLDRILRQTETLMGK